MCRPTTSERALAGRRGPTPWDCGSGAADPSQPACARDVDDGPAISMITLPALLSGPLQIHVQGRVERVSNALEVDQPAPGGRHAGSSSGRAAGKKSGLAPHGRSLSLSASCPRSHGRAEPHARRGAGGRALIAGIGYQGRALGRRRRLPVICGRCGGSTLGRIDSSAAVSGGVSIRRFP